MKRYIKSQSEMNKLDIITCMSKLTDALADKSRVGDIGKFIYFSTSTHSTGPRVKFWGGTRHTLNSRFCPSIYFTKDSIIPIDKSLYPRKDYPNVWDKQYVEKVEQFIENFRPILLLVWFEILDEAQAQSYFEGHSTFSQMLQSIDWEDETYDQMKKCRDTEELDQFCRDHNLYTYPGRV